MILRRLKRAWLQHILYRSRIPCSVWHKTIDSSALLARLDQRDRHRLRKLTGLFLHEKSFTGAGGLRVDESMRVYIAIGQPVNEHHPGALT
jgi:Mlc titration factor MtfA (ptsG expression regulator)